MISETEDSPQRHRNEDIKETSHYLRGTILEGLADTSTGSISEQDSQLTKFHGIYLQDDRDLRKERRKAKLEKAFSFMIRIRVPGGVCTPKQWLQMEALADKYANAALKITTRQAYQFHGVLKGELKQTIKEINEALLDTIAACGDVNRNVMCSANPEQSGVHEEVHKTACAISDHLTPKTKAYHEIWLDDQCVGGGEPEEEPIYGKTYLPRKFKIGIAVPPLNDVDVFSQDLGFIAIVKENKLIGFNVTVGGGMGMDHNRPATFPRLGDVLGFITPSQVIAVAEGVVTAQRDYGDRTNRKHARLKYTIEDKGIEWFREQVEERSGITFQPPQNFKFISSTDRYGWTKGIDGKWHFTLFILSGRIKDSDVVKIKTGLKAIAEVHKGDFRLTSNQNLIIGKIDETDRPQIEALLKKHQLLDHHDQTGLRLNAMSCVALPTCGLALAESERILPEIVTFLEKTIKAAGLEKDTISIRITGCPNGCARPYLAEIGLVGRSPGKYNIYLGGKHNGTRLNKKYKDSIKTEDMLQELSTIIERYAKERKEGEEFGDFVIRLGYVKATLAGRNFHDE